MRGRAAQKRRQLHESRLPRQQGGGGGGGGVHVADRGSGDATRDATLHQFPGRRGVRREPRRNIQRRDRQRAAGREILRQRECLGGNDVP